MNRVKIFGIFDSCVVIIDLIIIWVIGNLFRGVLIEVNCIKFFLVNILIIGFKYCKFVFGELEWWFFFGDVGLRLFGVIIFIEVEKDGFFVISI